MKHATPIALQGLIYIQYKAEFNEHYNQRAREAATLFHGASLRRRNEYNIGGKSGIRHQRSWRAKERGDR